MRIPIPAARKALTIGLAGLVLSSLACDFLNNLSTIPGPEDQATDAFIVSTPTPRVVTPAAQPSGTPLAQVETLTLDAADDAQAAMRPEFAADVASLPDATRYVLDVSVTLDGSRAATITGTASMRYANQQAFNLDTLYLMLWPNAKGDYLGNLTLGPVTVAGTAVQPVLEQDGLAARLPLSAPLAPGQRVELTAAFTATAVMGLEEGARYGLTHGVLLAPTFYPLIPRIVNGEWQTDPAPPGGDTTNSDTSFYLWRVTAPANQALVATGSVIDASYSGDRQTQVLVTGPVRDLALTVGPLEQRQRVVDGITVNAYVLASHLGAADNLLEQADTQIKNLEDRVGPYPFAELDIVDAPGAYGGIEYPALVYIGVVDDSSYESANVHEIGHQWFYSLIGDDQLEQPWLDEAAATYTEVLYVERAHGSQAAQSALDDYWSYVDASAHPELPIGLGVGDYPSVNEYSLLVYGKGALFFDALRRQLGDDVFFQFLHNYYKQYKYGFATSQGFQAVAESTCACDLAPLFDLWVYKGGPVKRP